MRTATCQICGNTFSTDRPNQKYCCLACSYVGARRKRSAWLKTNPGYDRNYARMYRARRMSKTHGIIPGVSEKTTAIEAPEESNRNFR